MNYLKQGIILILTLITFPLSAHCQTPQTLTTAIVPQPVLRGMGYWTQCDLYNTLELLPQTATFRGKNKQQQTHLCAYWSLYQTVLNNDRYTSVRQELVGKSPREAIQHIAQKPITEYPWLYMNEKLWMPLRPDWKDVIVENDIQIQAEARAYLAGNTGSPPQQTNLLTLEEIRVLGTSVEKHEEQIKKNSLRIIELSNDVAALRSVMGSGDTDLRNRIDELAEKAGTLATKSTVDNLDQQIVDLKDQIKVLSMQSKGPRVEAQKNDTQELQELRTGSVPWPKWFSVLAIIVIVLGIIGAYFLVFRTRLRVRKTEDVLQQMRSDDKDTKVATVAYVDDLSNTNRERIATNEKQLEDLSKRVTDTENSEALTRERVTSMEDVLYRNELGFTIVIPKEGNPSFKDLRQKNPGDEFAFTVFVNGTQSTITGRVAEEEKQMKGKDVYVYLDGIKKLHSPVSVDNVLQTIKRAIRDNRAENVTYPDKPKIVKVA